MADNLKNSDLPRLIELWQQLEKRIARIEDYLEIGSPSPGKTESGKTVAHKNTESIQAIGRKERSLEFKIGEYWLAQVGAFVLMLGVAFFVSYPFQAIPPLFVSLIGYLSVAGIFGLSKFWHKTYQYLSKILFGSSL